ncbi:MAG: cytochrome c [Myxococcota bacterium]
MKTRVLGGILPFAIAVGCSSQDPSTNHGTFLPPLPGTADAAAFQGPEALGVGPVRTAPRHVPGISGGTLLVVDSARLAVASDPDRDRILLMNLDSRRVTTIPLELGDEPGRAVEHNGFVSTLLRGSGKMLSFPVSDPTQITRRDVCAAPRGLAYDAANGRLIAACAGGEVMTFSDTGAGQLFARLHPDLRDVVITGGRLQVSSFRSAEIQELDPSTGALIGQPDTPIKGTDAFGGLRGGFGFVGSGEPTVAWRTISFNGATIIAHQRASSNLVSPTPGGYGSDPDPCVGQSSIVTTEVSLLRDRFMNAPVRLPGAVLPVDIAVSPAADHKVAVVAAGSYQVHTFALNALEPSEGTTNGPTNGCGPTDDGDPLTLTANPVAVAFDADGDLLVQTREPAQIYYRGTFTALGGASVADTGHDSFHRATGGGLACASCHAEGTDDGHTWRFDGIGGRRTQNLAGGISGSEPFHWSGDMNDFGMLVHEVFTGRMAGPELPDDHRGALLGWIDTIPVVKASPVVDDGQIARGKALFEDAEVACASCHAGSRAGRTMRDSVDVGTGEPLQVPALAGIAFRAPFMHSGCAPTLKDRFAATACGGGDTHGKTSHLSSEQVDDLVAYLTSL